ncbi:MAG: transcription termination/antitermination protein NusG [Albidovulum sp.]
MKTRLNRMMAKSRQKRPELWVAKAKQWRDIDETVPLDPAPAASGWVVLMVEPRMEVKAAAALRDAGYVAWYPQTVEETKNEKRKVRRKVNRPLFPRYLFAAAGEGAERFAWPTRDECRNIARRASAGQFSEQIKGAVERIGMLDCDHVSALVANAGEALIKELSIRQQGGEFVVDVDRINHLARGDRARVTDGPFRGFEGIVDLSVRDRVDVLISLFGREMAVKFEPGQVEAA